MLLWPVPNAPVPRAFKSAWVARAAKTARIGDAALRKAIVQVLAGRADDLGGGVFKQRLGNNQLRSIILARGGDCRVDQFLFAQQDRASSDEAELARFRNLAKRYGAMTPDQADAQVADGHWIEICGGRLGQGGVRIMAKTLYKSDTFESIDESATALDHLRRGHRGA